MAKNIELGHSEALPQANSEDLSKVVLSRLGLIPRKKDGIAKFHNLLLELYERKKAANREKKPEDAVMTVDEMGIFAGIRRQTMYDYLGRWLHLNILKKTSFVNRGKVIIGYELNGPTLEGAFRKAEQTIRNHVESTMELVKQIQHEVKREKLRNPTTNESVKY